MNQATMTANTISPKFTCSSCTRQHDNRVTEPQRSRWCSRVVFCLARFAARGDQSGFLDALADPLTHFHEAARSEIPNFQAPHLRYRRTLTAETADRACVNIPGPVARPQRLAQLPLVVPPLAIFAFARLMPRVRSPTTHVQAVVRAPFLDKRPLRAHRWRSIHRRMGRETVRLHRSLRATDLPYRQSGDLPAGASTGSHTIALRIGCATIRRQSQPSCSWGSKASEELS